MKILKEIAVCAAILATLSMSSCQSDEPVVSKNTPVPTLNVTEDHLVIAKSLSKAVKDQDVQKFLKQEALLKFDADHDILLQMIKSKEVRPGVTFVDILARQNESDQDLAQLIDRYPLLTIFIPDLPSFSSSTWKTGEVPQIGVATVRNAENEIKLVNDNGDISEISALTTPSFPVLVLKENERVRFEQPGSTARLAASPVFQNDLYAYYLTDATAQALPEGKYGSWNGFDIRSQDAYTKAQGCSNCYHRDYIYYNISPADGTTEGELDPHYSEAITSLRFTNLAALKTVASDWTEGALELHFNIFFIGGAATLDKLEKVYFVNTNEFLFADNRSVLNPLPFNLPTPITITPWHMDLYGDRWKINVYEYDPGTVVTQEVSHTSSKALNFRLDAEGSLFKLIKLGVGFGGSVSSETTSKTTIQTTLTSNNLGEAILNWTDPVIISKERQITNWISRSYEVSTGAINISIEPVKTY
jgi:hypothetical protein